MLKTFGGLPMPVAVLGLLLHSLQLGLDLGIVGLAYQSH